MPKRLKRKASRRRVPESPAGRAGEGRVRRSPWCPTARCRGGRAAAGALGMRRCKPVAAVLHFFLSKNKGLLGEAHALPAIEGRER